MFRIRIFILILVIINNCLTAKIKFRNQFYKSANGLLCQPCPAGKFLLKPCEQDGGESMCSVCTRGTFTNTENTATECEECTICRMTQRQRAPCTDTSDRVCECPQGLFWVQYLGYDSVCLHHTVCKDDEVVAVKGTPTSDTICKKAPPTTTLTTDRKRPVATLRSRDNTKRTDVQDINQNNSTKSEQYQVFKQGHYHKRPVYHNGIHKLWKPQRATISPPGFKDTTIHNTTSNITENHAHANGTMIKASVNETLPNAPAPVFESAVNASANETVLNSYKIAYENDKRTEAEPYISNKNGQTPNRKGAIIPNGIDKVTRNPLKQVTRKPSKTTSGGRRRKHKRGKGKKIKRRRKKNKKHGLKKKCRHKVEKKRKRCERRRKRLLHRKKKSEQFPLDIA